MLKISILLLTTLCAISSASQVSVVSKSQTAFLASPDTTKDWKIGDALCARDSKGVSACGKIVKITTKGYFVTVTFKKSETTVGMEVLKAKSLPASNVSQGNNKSLDISIGTQVSRFYLIPYLKFEFKLLNHVGLGFQPSIFLGSGTSSDFKAIGLGITTTVYQKENLEGFLASLALLPYYYMMTVNTDTSSELKFGGSFSVGYLKRLNSRLNFAVALGAQTLPFPDVLNATFDYTALQPYGSLALGFSF